MRNLYAISGDHICVVADRCKDIFSKLIKLQLNNEKNKIFSDIFLAYAIDLIFYYLFDVTCNGKSLRFAAMKVMENYALVTLNEESLKIFESNETFEIRHSDRKVKVKYFVKDFILHINIELNDLRYLLCLISKDEWVDNNRYQECMALLKDIENNGFDWKELDYKGFPWSNLILNKGK